MTYSRALLMFPAILGRHRPRIQYTYPPSPTSSGRSSPELYPHHHHKRTPHALSLAERLANLKAELATLESELIDVHQQESPAAEEDEGAVLVESEKAKKIEHSRGHVEPGELIQEVVDVKARLEKIGKLKEVRTGREKLVNAVLQGVGERGGSTTLDEEKPENETEKTTKEDAAVRMEVRDIAEMDRRLGELERAVGSVSTSADEVCPFSLPSQYLNLIKPCSRHLSPHHYFPC